MGDVKLLSLKNNKILYVPFTPKLWKAMYIPLLAAKFIEWKVGKVMKGNSDELTRGRGEVGTLKKPSAKKSNQKFLVPPESPASPERQKGPLRSRCPGAALRRLAAWRGEQQRPVEARPREWSAGHHRAWRAVEAERRTERAHCGGRLRLAPSRAASAGAVSGVPVAAAIRSWPERVNNDSV
jgi:hypothetical protein